MLLGDERLQLDHLERRENFDADQLAVFVEVGKKSIDVDFVRPGNLRIRKANVRQLQTVPMGAYVEREVPSTITDGERIMLLLKRPDFGTANNIQLAINRVVGENSASAFGAGAISIIVPSDQRSNLVAFIARIQSIDVETVVPSRVVVNERTGTIVVGGEVRIRPCQVAHGGLKISIGRTPLISQPLPFSDGVTVETEGVDIQVEETEAVLMPLEGVSAAEVAEGLNRLKVTTRDMIAIFQALREAGVMDADLEIM